MIIWINGPFGGGKTATAFELHRRLPGSAVFDPEEAGFFLRRVQPKSLHTEDFQDDPLWREINYQALLDVAQRHAGPVIVPMTVVKPAYYEALITRLRHSGIRVDHYALVARPETVRRRLQRRLNGQWALRRVGHCLEALYAPPFEGRIKTDNLPVPLVAEAIAKRSGLDIAPADRRPGGFAIKNLATLARHIRL